MPPRSLAQRTYALLLTVCLLAGGAVAQSPTSPGDWASYYATATGTGATLKSQLHNIIDGHTIRSYGDLRSLLQITDADPDVPGNMILAYDRVSFDLSTISGGSIPGWNGSTWNREHTWPRSRGVDSSGADNSDMHHLRPTYNGTNSSRGSLNFGGAYGQQSFGSVSDGGAKWYPGDADAGLTARQQFYMAVRYDGSDSATQNLELAYGNPGGTLGDLGRMLEWHYQAVPDTFERLRNDRVYGYQNNRNPFIDHPEYVWSVFVDQANDTRIALGNGQAGASGASTLDLDLGRVYVGGAGPASVMTPLAKTGQDGTYYSVTASGLAQSSLDGPYNAFSIGDLDVMQIEVGLDANSSTPGLYTGAVTIDNLDITTGAGAGRGALDGDDVISLSYSVLSHPVASLAAGSVLQSSTFDFGSVGQGDLASIDFDLFNYAGPGAPAFAALLNPTSSSLTGDSAAFDVTLDPLAPITQGDWFDFSVALDTSTVGSYSATLELMLDEEALPGAQSQSVFLTLMAQVVAAGLQGDFNGDDVVDALDYAVWRQNVGNDESTLSNNGDGLVGVDEGDLQVWLHNYGATASQPPVPAVPEPAALVGLLLAAAACGRRPRRAS